MIQLRADTASAARQRSSREAASLTDRECAVLDLVCLGLTNSQIAARLDIAVSTVKNHLRIAYIKLGVSSRVEALAVLLSQ